MAESTATDATSQDRETLRTTIDLESLDSIARPSEGAAHVTLELRESLLSGARLRIGETSLEFSVVDPALGTVEPRDGAVEEAEVPSPLVRAVLDRVGVGLVEPGEAP